MVNARKVKDLMNEGYMSTDKWLMIVRNSDVDALDFVESCMYESKYARDDWLSGREREVILGEIEQQRQEVYLNAEHIHPKFS